MSAQQARNTPDTSPGVIMVIGRALLGIAIGTAAAWAFVPAETAQAVIALALPLAAALTGWYGGREMGAAAAISGALWFGYAHTEPRFQTEIAARADVILTLAVLVVGILAGELADARHRLRQQRSDTVKR
jgi:K+-sensing histidine kinase KdpD